MFFGRIVAARRRTPRRHRPICNLVTSVTALDRDRRRTSFDEGSIDLVVQVVEGGDERVLRDVLETEAAAVAKAKNRWTQGSCCETGGAWYLRARTVLPQQSRIPTYVKIISCIPCVLLCDTDADANVMGATSVLLFW